MMLVDRELLAMKTTLNEYHKTQASKTQSTICTHQFQTEKLLFL